MIRKVSAEDIAIRGNGTGLEYMCPTRHFVYIFFNPFFQVSTAKNEIILFNNHILIVAPVTFAPAGAMTPSAEFLFIYFCIFFFFFQENKPCHFIWIVYQAEDIKLRKVSTICYMLNLKVNPCHAEEIKMPCPLLIFIQSNYLILVVDKNSNTEWQTVQIQISWLLHGLQWQGPLGVHQDQG